MAAGLARLSVRASVRAHACVHRHILTPSLSARPLLQCFNTLHSLLSFKKNSSLLSPAFFPLLHSQTSPKNCPDLQFLLSRSSLDLFQADSLPCGCPAVRVTSSLHFSVLIVVEHSAASHPAGHSSLLETLSPRASMAPRSPSFPPTFLHLHCLDSYGCQTGPSSSLPQSHLTPAPTRAGLPPCPYHEQHPVPQTCRCLPGHSSLAAVRSPVLPG